MLLTFALTTELFATNSPSVLYSQAVDKIRASDAVRPPLAAFPSHTYEVAGRTLTTSTQVHPFPPFISTSKGQSTFTPR